MPEPRSNQYAEYEQDGCASIHPEEDHDHPIPVFRVLLNDGPVVAHEFTTDELWPTFDCVICGKREAEHNDGSTRNEENQ